MRSFSFLQKSRMTFRLDAIASMASLNDANSPSSKYPPSEVEEDMSIIILCGSDVDVVVVVLEIDCCDDIIWVVVLK